MRLEWRSTLDTPDRFFERPILNSPYAYPGLHWELDEQGQPTQRIVERRRPAAYVTPIPKPKKRKGDKKKGEKKRKLARIPGGKKRAS